MITYAQFDKDVQLNKMVDGILQKNPHAAILMTQQDDGWEIVSISSIESGWIAKVRSWLLKIINRSAPTERFINKVCY